jgi:5'-3' exonuclease
VADGAGLRVHLVDGTYELFRQYHGQRNRPRLAADGRDVGAAWGVVRSVLTMVSEGARFVGVATDHVIESFRNDMWATYKDGSGVPADLFGQFALLEQALTAAGFVVWPMVELEADDALASAAAVCADDETVDQVVIWTPDKDLGQCVRDGRVVQFDRRNKVLLDEAAVTAKFGVGPASIPDWLALVGDSADGFPGIAGWGKQTAAVVLSHYGHLESIPLRAGDWDEAVARRVRGTEALVGALAGGFDLALLFREIATVRIDRSLLASPSELEWKGPQPEFEAVAHYLGDDQMVGFARSLVS